MFRLVSYSIIISRLTNAPKKVKNSIPPPPYLYADVDGPAKNQNSVYIIDHQSAFNFPPLKTPQPVFPYYIHTYVSNLPTQGQRTFMVLFSIKQWFTICISFAKTRSNSKHQGPIFILEKDHRQGSTLKFNQ